MNKDLFFDITLVAISLWFYHNFYVKKLVAIQPQTINNPDENTGFESRVNALISSMGY